MATPLSAGTTKIKDFQGWLFANDRFSPFAHKPSRRDCAICANGVASFPFNLT